MYLDAGKGDITRYVLLDIQVSCGVAYITVAGAEEIGALGVGKANGLYLLTSFNDLDFKLEVLGATTSVKQE